MTGNPLVDVQTLPAIDNDFVPAMTVWEKLGLDCVAAYAIAVLSVMSRNLHSRSDSRSDMDH